jgi:D-alanine--poly(phosphoribitol) ligase subunit 1
MVLARAASNPGNAAVEQDDGVVTYSDLCRMASGVASVVRGSFPAPCPRVLIAMPRSKWAYASMLGALMTGGTFCPLNVDGPPERNALITRLFSPHVILYAGKAPEFVDACGATTPRLDVVTSSGVSQPVLATELSDVAYVVFTSGSTGQPKGVKIGRRAFSYFLAVSQRYFKPEYGDRWGQFSNLGYDMAVMDVFMALAQGRVLVPLMGAGDQFMPAMAIKRLGITIWQSVPSVLELMGRAKQLTAQALEPLRVMSFCGEPLLPRHLEALFAARPDLQVFNTYGTTETTGFNTINQMTVQNYRESCGGPFVALGRDVPGWTVQLHAGDTPDDGEIVVLSDWLAHGYWADEERTRAAFRELRTEQGGVRRAYFTGDRGERRDGRLYFKCRPDRQIKVRGERIELDEVDQALRGLGFDESFTVYDGKDLYSFVEAPDNTDLTHVRGILAKRLPFHAVPKEIRGVPSLPRNANGKLDRAALQRLVSP